MIDVDNMYVIYIVNNYIISILHNTIIYLSIIRTVSSRISQNSLSEGMLLQRRLLVDILFHESDSV